MMILLLAVLAAPLSMPAQVGLIQARVVASEDRVNRPGNESYYERVRVEFINNGSAAAPLSFCARDARFDFARGPVRTDSRWHVDAYAFAASVGAERSWRTGCRTLSLAPGAPQSVTFFLRTDSHFGDSRRIVVSTNAGPFTFMPAQVRFAHEG